MSLPWITHRLPTRADADKNGRVVVSFYLSLDKNWAAKQWSEVKEGEAWLKHEPPCMPDEKQPRLFKAFFGSPETNHTVETRYAIADDGTAWYKKGNGSWQQEDPLPKRAKLTNPNQDKHE